jgi:proline dehydrogenase
MMRGMNARWTRRALFRLATSERFEYAARATPPGRKAAWRLAQRYVAGETAEDAFATARQLAAEGLTASLDLFGERVTAADEADRVTNAYLDLAARLPAAAPAGTWLSLDLSHLGVTADAGAATRLLQTIADALPDGVRLQVGAEEAAHTETIVNAIVAADRPNALSATVQANLRRSPRDADRLANAGIPIRLVKGAYVEPPEEALPYGAPTDLAYLQLAERLRGTSVLLATHDDGIREAGRRTHPEATVEMLLGVCPATARQLAATTKVRIYVPFGPDWFRYAMRRVAESRGA